LRCTAPFKKLQRTAQEYHADLVVIGRGELQELFGRMRTHVYSIIRETPCLVISLSRNGVFGESSALGSVAPCPMD
jgi:hypothetical protein